VLTLSDLASALGLSERQVRRRIAEARPVLAGHLSTGKAGAILCDSGGLEILRRLQVLTQEGLSMEAAVKVIQGELDTERRDLETSADTSSASVDMMSLFREIVAAKDGEIAALRSHVEALTREVAGLRQRLDELQPPALPGKRPWWLRWLP
jgi:chromosome segregation ATPase